VSALAARHFMRTLGALATPAGLSTLAFVAALLLPGAARAAEAEPGRSPAAIDPAIVRRLQALDPDSIGASEVAEVLAKVPAPRIILLQGSFGVVSMDPFAEFLIAMGYPAERIANPRDGSRSTASSMDSRQLAGMLAWYYETEGMRPLLIGHSQGGMLAIRVLYDLAGAFGEAIPVWNPLTDKAEPRTDFVDPRTGQLRPVVGLRMPYAAAIATGKLPRLLLGQWSMLAKLRSIPDTVTDFTGYSLEWDFIAGEFGQPEPYAATGAANVRNVTLPATYTHLGLPQAAHLAAQPVTRAWIDAYAPDAGAAPPSGDGVDTTNLVHAADIWHSVKKQWCLAARRLLAQGGATR
jgi:hypothetical protein